MTFQEIHSLYKGMYDPSRNLNEDVENEEIYPEGVEATEEAIYLDEVLKGVDGKPLPMSAKAKNDAAYANKARRAKEKLGIKDYTAYKAGGGSKRFAWPKDTERIGREKLQKSRAMEKAKKGVDDKPRTSTPSRAAAPTRETPQPRTNAARPSTPSRAAAPTREAPKPRTNAAPPSSEDMLKGKAAQRALASTAPKPQSRLDKALSGVKKGAGINPPRRRSLQQSLAGVREETMEKRAVRSLKRKEKDPNTARPLGPNSATPLTYTDDKNACISNMREDVWEFDFIHTYLMREHQFTSEEALGIMAFMDEEVREYILDEQGSEAYRSVVRDLKKKHGDKSVITAADKVVDDRRRHRRDHDDHRELSDKEKRKQMTDATGPRKGSRYRGD